MGKEALLFLYSNGHYAGSSSRRTLFVTVLALRPDTLESDTLTERDTLAIFAMRWMDPILKIGANRRDLGETMRRTLVED